MSTITAVVPRSYGLMGSDPRNDFYYANHASEALETAIADLLEATPHGRDFQMYKTDAEYQGAREVHLMILRQLGDAKAYADLLAEMAMAAMDRQGLS